MSGSEGYFVDTGDGIEYRDTAAEARVCAEAAIETWRDDDGWPEEVASVCWGRVVERVVELASEDEEPLQWCDYQLEAIAEGDESKLLDPLPITPEWLSVRSVGLMNTLRLCYRLVSNLPIGVCPPLGDLPACISIFTVVVKNNCTRDDIEALLRVFSAPSKNCESVCGGNPGE